MLKIDNIVKIYNNKRILDKISFSVNEGEILTILGNNGAGKTTIVNCILKLVKIDSGFITFFDEDIYSLNNNYFKNISALLESSVNVYNYLTGLDNIEYFIGLSKISKKASQKKIDYYIKLFKLEDSIKKPVGTYSRGMVQKLALMIAFLQNPKILLLDEPTLGLDIQSKALVIKILKEIVQKEKISIILTTHQMDVVEQIGGKILFLNKGKIEKISNFGKSLEKFILEKLNESD